MCFSAEASFTASAVIGAVSVATLRKARGRLIPFALVPLFFALQQFSEGMLWSTIEEPMSTVSILAMLSFLTFAYLIWPVWIPLSLLIAEKVRIRRLFLIFPLALGVSLVCYSLFEVRGNEVIAQAGKHIEYSLQSPFALASHLFNGIYLFVILIPCFVSSLKGIKIFGLLVGISWVVSLLFYWNAFTSVWCFFAAITGIFIYKIVSDESTCRGS